MIGLLAFDWNAWMGSRMEHFAENDKKKTHTQYWDFFIYAMFQWKFSYIKAQNTTINLIKVTDLSISQYFLMS